MTNTTTKKAANSIVGKLTAVILACAAAVAAVQAPAAEAQGGGPNVLVVGDSLQVGTGPYLEQQLGAVPVEFDQKQSRGSAEGLSVLQSRLLPEHTVVIFDLGTNDDPTTPNVLATTLNSARQVTGDRCLIVATILRPPYNGVSVDGMNAAIESFALGSPNVQLVDWYGIATSTPRILYSDGVHARPEGYALRGRLLADAVAACSGGGGGGAATSGIPAPSGEPAAPPREPEPPAEVEVQIDTPAPLVAIGAALREAAALVSAAAADARQASGMGPGEPVLGAG